MNLIIEPVLFPVVYDVLDCLRLVGEKKIKDCDFLQNYNFQKIHFNLISRYMEPDFWKLLLDELDSLVFHSKIPDYKLVDILEIIDNHIYKDYFKVIICDYIKKNNIFMGIEHFKRYLNFKHDFSYRMGFKTKLITEVSRFYNTIIIPRLWRDNDNNKFNRIHDLPANYYDDGETIANSSKYLMNEGTVYLLDPFDFYKVSSNLPKSFKFKMKDNLISFTKNEKKKLPTKINVNQWL